MCISTQQRYKDYSVRFYWSVASGTCVVYVTQVFGSYVAIVNGNRSMDLEFTKFPFFQREKKHLNLRFKFKYSNIQYYISFRYAI